MEKGYGRELDYVFVDDQELSATETIKTIKILPISEEKQALLEDSEDALMLPMMMFPHIVIIYPDGEVLTTVISNAPYDFE